MMTPQEVQEKTFSKAVFGGYDMAAVDDFLEPLTEDYIALYKENAVLKSKMKVLVETVESYRGSEDAMRSVLVNAQKTADQIIADAKLKAEQITADAFSAASVKTEDIDAEVKAHEAKLDAAKQNTLDYIEKMRKVYNRQLEFLENLQNLEEHHREVKTETPAAVEAAPAPVADLDQTRRMEPVAEAEPEAAPEAEEAAKPRFEFIDLQFGKDYELK